MIRIVEEVLLLVLDEEHGDLSAAFPSGVLDVVVAGAVLMELALEGRIDTDLDRLFVTDATPLDDDLLDPTLVAIAEGGNARSADDWLVRTAERAGDIRRRAIDRLVERGILELDSGGGAVFFASSVARSRRYPGADGDAVEEVWLRIMRILFSEEIPDSRDIVIVCLADASGVLQRRLSTQEREELRERIDLLRRLDLIGRFLIPAIQRRRRSAEAPKTVRQPDEIPEVEGLPVLGSALSMTGDLNAFFSKQYQALGPVFRVRALNRRLLVLAGPEAVRFLQRGGRAHLRAVDTWPVFGRELGTSQFLHGLDGPVHTRLRKAMAPGFSPRHVENRMAEFMDVTRSEMDGWIRGGPVRVRPSLQRMIVRQISVLCGGVSTIDFADELDFFLGTAMTVHVARRRSKLWLKHPRIARARGYLSAYVDQLQALREEGGRPGGAPDLVDILLELHRTDPQLLSEENLPAELPQFLFTGIHTVAYSCAFVLYEALKRPDLLDRMRAEADALFADGMPSVPALAQFDVIHRFVMETLRVHPIGFALQRRVTNSFPFEGYRIPAGSDLLFSTAAAHLVPEHFPDPQRFDIERYSPGRDEHRAPGVYVPYGAGAHSCIGKGLAQIQMVLTLATILHELDLTMAPPGYKLKVSYGLAPRPGNSFKFKVRRRNASGASSGS